MAKVVKISYKKFQELQRRSDFLALDRQLDLFDFQHNERVLISIAKQKQIRNHGKAC